MAKKNDKVTNDEDLDLIDDDEEYDDYEEGSGKSGCLIKIIVLIVILIIIAVPTTLIATNVGNVRDQYLRPVLEKIPIVKNILPPVEEEVVEEVIDPQQQTIDALNQEIEQLNQEIARLKEFENAQLQFKAEKEQFDQMIALNDPSAYATFYESIAPENAEELYKQVVATEVDDKQLKEYIQTFENMKKDSIASILEELMVTDIDLVISILQNLSSDKRSEVLAAMSTENAASVARLLAPTQE